MKNFMRNLMYVMLWAFVLVSVFSCENDKYEDDIFHDELNEELDDVLQSGVSLILRELYDSVFTAQGDTAFVLKVGECINASEPNKYYIVAEDTSEAAIFYNSYCTNESWAVKYKEAGDSLALDFDVCNRTTNFGDYGSTSLQIGGEEPAYATITLDITAVGEEHLLVFVPSSFMPNNDNLPSFSSPYKLGQILKDDKGIQWLCVEPSTLTRDGYLIRFGWDGVERYYSKDCCKTVYFFVFQSGDKLASKEVCNAFVAMLGVSQGKKAYNAMCDKDSGVSMWSAKDACATFYGDRTENYTFQVGGCRFSNWSPCFHHFPQASSNHLFEAESMEIGYQKSQYLYHHVRVSSIHTGSSAPMRMKTFRKEKFAKWTSLFPPDKI